MKFQIVPGENFKIFVAIKDLQTKEDFELYDVIVKTLSRAEYMPFMQGFNKTVSYSYLFYEYIFPVQFLPDVLNVISKLSSKPIEIENEHLIINDNIIREEFDEYVNSLKFPDNINITSDDYKYQRDSVFLALKYQTAKIEVGTSGGKTFITYLYCRWLFDNYLYNPESDEPNKKILIVVPTKLLCNQLKKDFSDYNKFMKRPLAVETIFTGAKQLLDADIVCGTFQSLSSYDKEYFDDFGVFICDEVHRAKAYSIKNEIYNKLYNCEYFFGMTGTLPEYKTLDYLHIVSMFGKTVVEVSASELIDKGVATPVEISVIKINYGEDSDFSTELKNNDIVGKDKYYVEKEYFQTNIKRTIS